MTHGTKSAADLRAQLGYPVLDGDGHIVEIMAVFLDYVAERGHADLLQGMFGKRRPIEDIPLDERRAGGICPHSWHTPSTTEYYATVTSPKRYHERLDEAGIDFMVLYPTAGISFSQIHHEEQRVTMCRLYNEWAAEMYGGFGDRFARAAIIPMHTPAEAIAALEHAKSVGAKVGMIASHVHRPHRGETWPPDDEWASSRIPEWETLGWVDTFGIDSPHDYDPVWAKAIELQIPLAAHTAGMGSSDRASVSNFNFNQIGHFAAAGHALAKSLFFGGVTKRFPDLRVALLEGGVAVGVQTYVSLVGNWEKRGGKALAALDPENIDKDLLVKMLVENDPRLAKFEARALTGQTGAGMTRPVDDFAAADINSVSDLHDRFVVPFAWGCEADDPFVGVGFDHRITPDGSILPAFFASDLGHWDVPEFDEPLKEAYELVEKGLLDEAQLREFLFVNPMNFYTGMNPDFFVGTRIEDEVATARGR
jgi:predicted TIM-barrel fold metal-dependent hydrolase